MAEEVGRLSAVFDVDLKPLDRGLRQASKMLSGFESRHGSDTDVELNLKGVRGFQSGLQQASRAVSDLDGEDATVNVNERGAAATTAKIQTVTRFVQNLHGQNATAHIRERGAVQTSASVAGVHGIVGRLNGQDATVQVRERGAASTDAALGGVVATANRANGQDVRINVRESGSGRATAGLGMLSGAMLGAGAAAAAMDNGLSLGKVRILALGGIAVTVAALFTPLLGGLASLGALAAGAAGGVGLLAAAFIPTIIALSNHEEATNKVATAQKAADTSARSLADANASLQSATAGVADAQRSAAEGVAAAEGAYQDALRAVADAEEDVTKAVRGVGDARREANEGVQNAVKRYEDSLESVADAERSLAKAARGVEDARREANEGVQDAVAAYQDSLEDVRDAEEDVAEAVQGVRDARREANEGVQDAVESYRDSLRSVEDAERSLHESRLTLNGATRDLIKAQVDLNYAMQEEPRNQAYAALDLADARDRASDATKDYNEAVKEYGRNSEEATDADRRRQRAQLDLQRQEEETNKTRRNGSDELNSAKEAVQNASEGERKAREGVAESERALLQAREDAGQAYAGIAAAQEEGARRIADAQGNVADAQERVTEAVQASNEAQAGIEEARVEGARRIADAQEQVADAQRRVASAVEDAGEAQAGIERARIDGARRVADAQEQVGEAQDRVTDAVRKANEAQAGIETARIDGARQVAEAQEQVSAAQLRVARATEDAAAAQAKLAEAGAESGAVLTASQQAILDKLGVLKSQFSTAFAPATEGMNRLAARVLDFTTRAMPALGVAATATMLSFGSAINSAMSNFSSGPAVAAMQTVLAGMAPIIGSLTIALADLSLGLIGIFAAAMPSAIALAEHISGLAAAFSEWALSAEGASQITAAIATATPVFQALWNMVMQVGGALYQFGVENGPAIAAAIGMISGAVTAVINAFSWLTQTLGPVVLVFAALAPVVIGAMVIIGSLATAFMALMPIVTGAGAALMFLTGPIGGIILVAAALAAGIHFLYTRFKSVRTVVNAVGTFLKGAGLALFRFFYAGLTGDTQYFANLWKTVWGAVKGVAIGAANGIKAGVGAVWDWLKSATSAVGSAVVAAWQGLANGVTAAREWMQAGIRRGWEWIKSFSLGLFEAFKSGVIAIWESFVRGVTVIREGFQAGIRRGWEWIRSFSTGLFNGLRDFLVGLWQGMTDRITSIREGFQAGIRRGWEWVRDFSVGLYEGVRDRLVSIWQGLGDKITSIREKFQSGIRRGFEWIRNFAGGIWDEIGRRIVNSFSGAINKARKWLGGLMTAVGNVLSVLSMDKLAGAAKDRAAQLNTPLAMASGGIVERRDGGMANSPTVLYGEAGPEAYVRLDKKTPESQRAAQAVMRSPNAPEHIPHRAMAQGGISGVREMTQAVVKKWPGVRLVDRHAEYMPADQAARSMDFFVAPSGTVAQGADRRMGDEIAAFLAPPSADTVVWMDQMNYGSGWVPISGAVGLGNENSLMHRDHVHGMAHEAGFKGGLGVGSSGGMFDWMSAITDGLKGVGTPNIGAGILGEGFAGYGKTLLGKAKDWLVEKAKEVFGSITGAMRGAWGRITGGGTPDQNRELGKKMLEASNVGGSFSALDSLWTKESGWNQYADNPSSDAYGIPQGMMGPGGHTPPPGYMPPESDPKVQIGWGLDYIKGRHGTTDAAWGHSQSAGWYAAGGIIPGSKGKSMLIQAHAGERVLPVGLTNSFDRLAESIELWSSGADTAGGGFVGSGSGESVVVEELRTIRKENAESARVQAAILASLPKDMKESVDYNLENSRSTRRASVRGYQREQSIYSQSGGRR